VEDILLQLKSYTITLGVIGNDNHVDHKAKTVAKSKAAFLAIALINDIITKLGIEAFLCFVDQP